MNKMTMHVVAIARRPARPLDSGVLMPIMVLVCIEYLSPAGSAGAPAYKCISLGLSTFVVGLSPAASFAASFFRECGLGITRQKGPSNAVVTGLLVVRLGLLYL